MNRRDVIKSLSIITGCTILASELFLTSCSSLIDKKRILSLKQVSLIEDIAETILPKTRGAIGAKEAKIGEMVNAIVTDFYNTHEQNIFLEGLDLFKQDGFDEMTPKLKNAYMLKFQKESESHQNNNLSLVDKNVSNSFFPMIKKLSVWAYLCSKSVATTAFNYLPLPAKYDTCVEVDQKTKPMYWNPDPEILKG